MNIRAIQAIYLFEMARTWRTLLQSIVSPVVSTSLYFVVFGSAIGSRITQVEGVSYGTFIVPGLVMLSASGYGQTGPRAQWAGHDLNYLAVGGFLDVCGRLAHTRRGSRRRRGS